MFSRVRGLLGKKSLPAGHAMVIKPCNQIHTFFMQFSIDVLFVDKNNNIVKLVNSLVPNRLTSICWRAAYVVELPAGTISNTSATLFDPIAIIS